MAIAGLTEDIGPLESPKEICKEFRIKVAPFMDAIESGRVPHIKIGRSRYVVRSVFQKWLEQEAQAGRRAL